MDDARAGSPDEALNWLRQAVRYDAADGDAHLVMSAVLAAAGRKAEAQREFELARLLGTSLEAPSTTIPTAVPEGLERLVAQLEPRTGPRAISAIAQRDQEATATETTRVRSSAASARARRAIASASMGRTVISA